MNDNHVTEIVKLADGSVDYGYYMSRASNARNGELKSLARGLFEVRAARGPGISVLATVVMLAILL